MNVTKVMRYQLIYQGGGGDFESLQNQLWEFQRQTRAILNKTIQTMYLATANQEKFSEKALYHDLCAEYPDMISSTVNATLREATKKYRSSVREILAGRMSLPSYKRDHPILLHNQSVALKQGNQGSYFATISVFSRKYQQGTPGVKQPSFQLIAKDNTQRTILQRLLSGEYKLGQCQLIYIRPKWFLNVAYSFTPSEKALDQEKVLGVDLGCVYAIYASSYGNHGIFKISGDEITSFERKQAAIQNRAFKNDLTRIREIEERRKQKLEQARYCGEGRIGHGVKTRVAPAYQDEGKISRFRETINHRYSKALVDYAEKNGYGTIQMEDLSGIKSSTGFPKRLQHWTYFDLQQKIKYKAEEQGIKVVKIKPAYTSQRCSRCGHIDPANRKSQSEFKCIACGFSSNADYNASQNISMRNIEKIIQGKAN
jgi:IS605 OrfB family transposase